MSRGNSDYAASSNTPAQSKMRAESIGSHFFIPNCGEERTVKSYRSRCELLAVRAETELFGTPLLACGVEIDCLLKLRNARSVPEREWEVRTHRTLSAIAIPDSENAWLVSVSRRSQLQWLVGPH